MATAAMSQGRRRRVFVGLAEMKDVGGITSAEAIDALCIVSNCKKTISRSLANFWCKKGC
jgi:hypothetical protein